MSNGTEAFSGYQDQLAEITPAARLTLLREDAGFWEAARAVPGQVIPDLVYTDSSTDGNWQGIRTAVTDALEHTPPEFTGDHNNRISLGDFKQTGTTILLDGAGRIRLVHTPVASESQRVLSQESERAETGTRALELAFVGLAKTLRIMPSSKQEYFCGMANGARDQQNLQALLPYARVGRGMSSMVLTEPLCMVPAGKRRPAIPDEAVVALGQDGAEMSDYMRARHPTAPAETVAGVRAELTIDFIKSRFAPVLVDCLGGYESRGELRRHESTADELHSIQAAAIRGTDTPPWKATVGSRLLAGIASAQYHTNAMLERLGLL
jgi:hypothetical protein